MILVKGGLNNQQISLMRPIYMYIEKLKKKNFSTETSGLNSEGGLYFEWSL